ncbi:hypothetical protein H4R34_001644 [Dimargaris verticillata]|uniref:Mediator complex subunit 5 n=1 Tax=Dimargaris verticillata TaxID=2761393 RepID=A0A9W8BAZ1_9FUNG|nr:hypothetical protein H4R34_001644 [Dimargaris verticillata]
MPTVASAQAATFASWSVRLPATKWHALVDEFIKGLEPATATTETLNLIGMATSTPLASPVLAEYLDKAVTQRLSSPANGPASPQYLIPLSLLIDRILTRYQGPKSIDPLAQAYVHYLTNILVRWAQQESSLVALQAADRSRSQPRDRSELETAGALVLRWLALFTFIAEQITRGLQRWAEDATEMAMIAMAADSNHELTIDQSHQLIADSTPPTVKPSPKADFTSPSSNPQTKLAHHQRLLDNVRSLAYLLTQLLQSQWKSLDAHISQLMPTLSQTQRVEVSQSRAGLADRAAKLQTQLQSRQDHLMGETALLSLLIALHEQSLATAQALQTIESAQAVQRRIGYVPLSTIDIAPRVQGPQIPLGVLFAYTVTIPVHIPSQALAAQLRSVATLRGWSAQDLYLQCWLSALQGLAEISVQDLTYAQMNQAQVWRAFVLTKLPDVFRLLVYHKAPEHCDSELAYQDAVIQRFEAMEQAIMHLTFFKDLLHRCNSPNLLETGDIGALVTRVSIRRGIVRPEFILSASTHFPTNDALDAAALLAPEEVDSLVATLQASPSDAACEQFVTTACVDAMNQPVYLEALITVLRQWKDQGQYHHLARLCRVLTGSSSLIHILRLQGPLSPLVNALKSACNSLKADGSIATALLSPNLTPTTTPHDTTSLHTAAYTRFEHVFVFLLQIWAQAGLTKGEIIAPTAQSHTQSGSVSFMDQWLRQYTLGVIENRGDTTTAEDPSWPIDSTLATHWFGVLFNASELLPAIPEELYCALSPQQWLALSPVLMTQALYGCLAQVLSSDHIIHTLTCIAQSPARFGLVGMVQNLGHFILQVGHDTVHAVRVLDAVVALPEFPMSLLTLVGPGVWKLCRGNPALESHLWNAQAKLLPYLHFNTYMTPMLDTQRLIPNFTALVTHVRTLGRKCLDQWSHPSTSAGPVPSALWDMNLVLHLGYFLPTETLLELLLDTVTQVKSDGSYLRVGKCIVES